MRSVSRAVITAAGRGTRHFPATHTLQKELMPLIDRDGVTKPAIQIILEEALSAGIEEFCLVTSPGSGDQIRRHFSGLTDDELVYYRGREWALREAARLQSLGERIHYVTQQRQDGYGHAVYCAREFVGDSPFLLLLGDHVFIHRGDTPCSRQAIEAFEAHQAPVSGVQRTPEELLHLFGTVTGQPIPGADRQYEVTRIEEKPARGHAREHLRTPGLEADEYLCFFGVHVLPAAVFDCLEHHIRRDIRESGEIQLTSSLEMLRRERRYLAVEISGTRHDLGVPYGFVETQIALALHSPERDRILARLRATDL
jgi:UTP--glucose-1-phosphate uridylyltransferase